jgi:transcription antitermination factor NusG
MTIACETDARCAERLWQVAGDVTDTAATAWHVLQTKSRQEKALAETLSARGLQFFLPLINVNRVYGGRRAKAELPLFPGYLFLKGSLEDVYTADRTKRVAKVIPVFDQQKLHEELRSLQLALQQADQAASFDPFPFLKRGIRVEVTSGPLRGVRGVIEDRRRRDRLILQVNVLGQATSLEVDSAVLEPVGEN